MNNFSKPSIEFAPNNDFNYRTWVMVYQKSTLWDNDLCGVYLIFFPRRNDSFNCLQQQFLSDEAHYNPIATGQESFLHDNFLYQRKLKTRLKIHQKSFEIQCYYL